MGQRHHQLRQRSKLRQGLPDDYPALTKAIYETNGDITVNALFGWLKK